MPLDFPKEEYAWLRSEVAKSVTAVKDGCGFESVAHISGCTIKQSGTTADRLHSRIVQQIGNIMSEEDPKMAHKFYRRKHSYLKALTTAKRLC